MTTQTQTAGASSGMLMTVGIIGLLVSLGIALTGLVSEGHAAFNTTSDGVAWGLPVATYVFFVLTSTGLTFVASLAMVFGLKDFYPIAKRCVWLAVATLLGGFATLAFELGHPFRMLWAIPLSFQFSSAMNWMGIFYALYLVFLLFKFNKMHAGDWESGASRNLGFASLLSVIVAHATLGLVFGMMAMRPFWYDGLIPVYFLATAFLSGLAFAVLATYVSYGFSQNRMPSSVRTLVTGALPKLFALALGVVLLFHVSRTITGLWSNAEGMEAFDWLVASPWFWLELVALVAAFVLLLAPDKRMQAGTQALASVLVIVALFIGRYEFTVGGQVVPLFKGNWMPGIVEYTPSLVEWMLALLGLSLAFTIYAVGDRILRLGDTPPAAAMR